MSEIAGAAPAATRTEWKELALVALGDVTMFLLFAVIGVRSHDAGVTLRTVGRAALPFALSWLLLAPILGAFRDPAIEEPRQAWKTALKSWVPACAAGLAIRALVLGRGFAVSFAVVAFLTNAVFLSVWRTVYSGIRKRRGRL